MLEMYNDPDELEILVDAIDYDGKDCFWYLDHFSLYTILDCRIMDRIIQKKWKGKYSVNSSFLYASTSWTLIDDKFSLYATDRVFSEL